MPRALMIGGPIAAAVGGVSGVLSGAKQRKWIDAAAYRFEEIGSDEARQVAQLIRDNPRAANRYVEQYFGGWENLETGLRERQHQARATEAVAGLQALSPEERAGMDPQEAYLGLADEVARGDMSREAAVTLSQTFGAPEAFVRALQHSGASAQSIGETVKRGMESGEWDPSTLEAEPERRVNVTAGGGLAVESTYDPATGETTYERKVIPGSDLDELTKTRPGGPWLQRLVLHERLVRAGIKRKSPEYNAEYDKVGMEPLTDQELLDAETRVRATAYESPRASEAERLLEAFGRGIFGAGGTPAPSGAMPPGS